jgi:hypothetical protein
MHTLSYLTLHLPPLIELLLAHHMPLLSVNGMKNDLVNLDDRQEEDTKCGEHIID